MIVLKSEDEIKKMAESCRIVAEVLEGIKKNITLGVSTKEIDEFAESFIITRGAQPAFKGYRGYPASVCTSINEQVVHGIPSSRKLKDGDIISLDIGVLYKGFYGDAAVTLPVGSVSNQARKLISVTEKALEAGMERAVAGNRLSDISSAVQGCVEAEGFSIVRSFVGHGIGRELHEEPQIPNFGKRGSGVVLKEGMVICIEPMVTMGDYNLKKSSDGYGYASRDNSLTAHFEHTIAITKKGPQILTL